MEGFQTFPNTTDRGESSGEIKVGQQRVTHKLKIHEPYTKRPGLSLRKNRREESKGTWRPKGEVADNIKVEYEELKHSNIAERPQLEAKSRFQIMDEYRATLTTTEPLGSAGRAQGLLEKSWARSVKGKYKKSPPGTDQEREGD